MQVIFIDPGGHRVVLSATNVSRLAAEKQALGWRIAPENPPAVHAAATHDTGATSGLFLDPRGFTMRLSASTHGDFRQLVTRKLANGWKRLPQSPAAAPLVRETVVALGPPEPEPPPLPPPPVFDVPVEERIAAVDEAYEAYATDDE